MPFLSVIVPIYNAERYLRECLDSIMAQSFQDFEVLLVNDGSKDRSVEIIKEYEEKFSFVRVISQENKGLIGARKAGLLEAKGTYIGWVDADDCVTERMYEVMCQEAKETDADMVICDMCSLKGNELIPLPQAIEQGGLYEGIRLNREFIPKMLYAGHFYTFGILPAHFNKITKVDLLKKHLLNLDERIVIGEDAACTYFCMLDSQRISYLKGSYFYHYRANMDSMCFQWKENKIQSAASILPYMYQKSLAYTDRDFLTQLLYYFVMIYTNVYFEYGTYAVATKQKEIWMKESIPVSNEIRELLQNALRELKLPYDRKWTLQTALAGKSPGWFLRLLLRVRFHLMVQARKA